MYTQTYKKKILFLSQYKRISGKNIDFDNKSIKKSAFYKNKSVFRIEDIDVNKIFISKKNPMVQKKAIKYFIGYNNNNNNNENKLLSIRFPQMIGCAKYFDDNKNNVF